MKNEKHSHVFKLTASTLSAFGFLLGAACYAMPAQVVLLRHAEKPESGNELNDRGRARSRALVEFFKSDEMINRFGPPAAIFATKPHRDGSSIRMLQTMEPYSKSSGLPIIAEFERDQVHSLVDSIRNQHQYDGKTVLICWQSESIPKLAKAFGLKKGPRKWNHVYDRVWILRFEKDSVIEFKDLPQKVLPDDSKA